MKVTNTSSRLKELMSYFNIKQVDIVNRTGLVKSKVSMYVNGLHEPKQDSIYIISKAFDVDPAWLMGFDVPMMNNPVSNDNIEKAAESLGDAFSTDDKSLLELIEIWNELPEEKRESLLTVAKCML